MKEKEIEDIESFEPEPHFYDPCVPQPKITTLPHKAEEMKYPSQGLQGADNPKYMTSNGAYGRVKPSSMDQSTRYVPMNNKFTHSFLG